MGFPNLTICTETITNENLGIFLAFAFVMAKANKWRAQATTAGNTYKKEAKSWRFSFAFSQCNREKISKFGCTPKGSYGNTAFQEGF